MVKRELLRDHSAHRNSIDMRPGDSSVIEHSDDIVRHIRQRPWTVGMVAFASSPVVNQDGAEAPGNRGDERLAPGPRRATVAHYQSQRIALAANLVADSSAVAAFAKSSIRHFFTSRVKGLRPVPDRSRNGAFGRRTASAVYDR